MKQIPLEERQRNIQEAIAKISDCNSPNDLRGVLGGELNFWEQTMNNKYMHQYPYMDDIHTVLLYVKNLPPEKIQMIKATFGDRITQTLHAIGYNRLMEQHQNELLEEFMQPVKEVA